MSTYNVYPNKYKVLIPTMEGIIHRNFKSLYPKSKVSFPELSSPYTLNQRYPPQKYQVLMLSVEGIIHGNIESLYLLTKALPIERPL